MEDFPKAPHAAHDKQDVTPELTVGSSLSGGARAIAAGTAAARNTTGAFSARIRAHIAIARIDHWTKNVFVIPGIILSVTADHTAVTAALFVRVVVGLLATGLIASSNYVLNELLDAPYDRYHPVKSARPAALGMVSRRVAYGQWLLLMILGLALAASLHTPKLTATLAALWVMGCIYNVPPVRSKDVPYLDVLSESVNNPLRMLAGWYMAGSTLFPPASLLLSYWMVGANLMGLKRFSEYRQIGDPARAALYRRSFEKYSERSLLVSIAFYAAAAMLFFGAFIARYRIELLLSFPFIALVMAVYHNMAFDADSAVQNPESLHRHRGLMLSVALCSLVMIALLMVDLPILQTIFEPTMPTTHGLGR